MDAYELTTRCHHVRSILSTSSCQRYCLGELHNISLKQNICVRMTSIVLYTCPKVHICCWYNDTFHQEGNRTSYQWIISSFLWCVLACLTMMLPQNWQRSYKKREGLSHLFEDVIQPLKAVSKKYFRKNSNMNEFKSHLNTVCVQVTQLCQNWENNSGHVKNLGKNAGITHSLQQSFSFPPHLTEAIQLETKELENSIYTTMWVHT